MDIAQLFNLTPELIEKLQAGGYLVMFTMMVIEWPFVTMAAAFLASMGIFNIFVVAILGWLGDTVGDVIFFLVGRFGLSLFTKNRKIDTEQKANFMEKLNILLEKNFVLSLIAIKFTPYAPMIALPYLGTKKSISAFRFIFLTALLSIPVPLTVALVGFHIESIRRLIATIPEDYQIFAIIVGVLLLLAIAGIIFFIFRKYYKIFQEKIEKYVEKLEKSQKKSS